MQADQDRGRKWPGRSRSSGLAAALPGYACLMDHIVVEEGIVRHHDQQRQPVMRRGPDRGPAHQEVAVTQDGHRQPSAALQRERGAHGHSRPGADARTAVHPQVVQRMVYLEIGAAPAERDPDQAGRRSCERAAQRSRQVVHEDAVAAVGYGILGRRLGAFRDRPFARLRRLARFEQGAHQQVRIGGHGQVNGLTSERIHGPAVAQRRVRRSGDDPRRVPDDRGWPPRRWSRPGRSSRGSR